MTRPITELSAASYLRTDLPIEKVYDKDNPPSRMSEAIRMAVADVEQAEKSQRYIVDMDHWHQPYGDRCLVCFAGSVMSQRLGLPFNRVVRGGFSPDAFELDAWGCVFRFLNCIREGDLEEARRAWAGATRPLCRGGLQNTEGVTSYRASPAAFKSDMLTLADKLEAEGS